MFKNIRIFIQPEDVYQYFLDHKSELEDNMKMIASTDTDDFDKKSFLFMAVDDGDLFLSLESPEEIDKYLLNLSEHYYSYLYDFGPFKNKNVYAYTIRSPGSSKGHIFVNENNTIVELKFYSGTLRYFKEEVKKLEKEFIGYTLIKEE